MKIRMWMLLMILCSSATQAEEKCEHAVDQADSLNVNLKECDGEKSGLNAAIHNYFNREAKGSPPSSPSNEGNNVKADKRSDEQHEIFSQVITNAHSLSNERFQLMLVVLTSCTNGVRISDELVVPAKGGFKIKLIFNCL